MTDPKTAAELHELVKLWPEEARPICCDWWTNPQGAACFHYGPCMFENSHAIDLHVASGIRWLLKKDLRHLIPEWTDNCHPEFREGYFLDDAQVDGCWPTLFPGIHAAILSQKGKA